MTNRSTLFRGFHSPSAGNLAAPGLEAKDPKLARRSRRQHLASMAAPRRCRGQEPCRERYRVSGLQARRTGPDAGTANVLSEGSDAHRDQIQFDRVPGRELRIRRQQRHNRLVQPGRRSMLSMFVHQFEVMMKRPARRFPDDGVGSADVTGRQPKLDYSGIKKVDGRQVHEMKYRPKKGGDL